MLQLTLHRWSPCTRLLVTLIAMLVVFTKPALGADKHYVVIIAGADSKPYQKVAKSFEKSIHQSTSVSIDIKYLTKETQQSDGQLIQQVENPPDLILTLGSKATRLVANHINDRPIVAGLILNSKLINNIPNATGVTLEYPIEVQLKQLHNVLPNKKKVGVLYNPAENIETIKQAEIVSQQLGLTLIPVAVNSPRDIPSALDTIAKRADVLWGIPDKTVMSSKTIKAVMLSSFRNRIPFIGLSSPWVKAGALYALDWDYQDLGVQCAELALKALDGIPINQIHFTTPRKSSFSINLKTARHMKIDLSGNLIADASQVFE